MAQTPTADSKPYPSSTLSQPTIDPIAHLDALLETYLSNVDAYTTLRNQLSQQFRAGFFSLAQAQRASTLGPGRRYGQESYDERMKAVRRIKIVDKRKSEETTPEDRKGNLDVVEETSLSFIIEEFRPQTTTGREEDIKQPENETEAETEPKPMLESESRSKSRSRLNKYDPLRQFGVLVPPALRQCQSSFISALSSTIPGLVNTALQLRRLEEQIESARRSLELNDLEGEGRERDGEVDETDTHTEKVEKKEEEETSAEEAMPKHTISTPLRSTLASRAREPRIRVLKMD